MSLDVSVIVPTYNREEFLSVCLDCLFDQDHPADRYEIIVVDDASTDFTEQMVSEKHPDCRLRYLRQPRTMGNGAAKNRGVSEAEGNVVIFIDSDAFAPPWYVREYAKSHMLHPHAVVDGPAISIRVEDMISRPRVEGFGSRLLASMDFFGEAFVNANASCTRDDFLKVGGFDESFLKWQDLELYERMKQSGITRVRNRRAYVLHCEAGRECLPDIARHMRSSGKYAALFYGKHPSAWARRKTRLRYLAYDSLIDRLGWTKRYLTAEGLRSHGEPLGLKLKFFRRLHVMHSYAEGLREGFGQVHMEGRGG